MKANKPINMYMTKSFTTVYGLRLIKIVKVNPMIKDIKISKTKLVKYAKKYL
jgi:hypothetical protein